MNSLAAPDLFESTTQGGFQINDIWWKDNRPVNVIVEIGKRLMSFPCDAQGKTKEKKFSLVRA